MVTDPSLFTRRPEPVHRHSLNSRVSNLYLIISLMTCAVFDVSNIVGTFHVAMWILVLGQSRASRTSDSLLEPFVRSTHTANRMAQVHYRVRGKTIRRCFRFTGWSRWHHVQHQIGPTQGKAPVGIAYRGSLRHTNLPITAR